MNNTPQKQPALAVEVTDLHLHRGTSQILRGITCRIPKRTCTAILGPNGCGKTTLTRCITGHLFGTRGTLRVLGAQLGEVDLRALRQRIGVVNPTVDAASAHIAGAVVDGDLTAHQAVVTGFFQTVGLYDIPTAAQRAAADHVLTMVGLRHRRELRFALLSTGEQRRCLIARALVHRPELLILDEPTAALDLAGREHVLATVEMILAAPNPPTVMLITHHVEEISPRTSQVLLMKEGRILASGAPAQILTPELLTRTFGCKVFVRRLHGRYWVEVLPEAWLDLVKASTAQSGAAGSDVAPDGFANLSGASHNPQT
jgi:iron complex transport system ATP-binding protein